MLNRRKITRFFANPAFRFGIPMVAGGVLGTMFLAELVRINNLLPNRQSSIREEDLKDNFDINKELKVRLLTHRSLIFQ